MKNIIVLLSALFVFGILFIIFILPLDESPECLTADQVIDLDINPSQFKDFRLVAEISGSHDKVVLISLYPKNVTFDGCGTANQPRISEEIADDNRQIKKIVIRDKQIELTYIDTKKPVDYSNLKVIWE